ncbi:MAG: YggS family pyridoxal phosphate-dependent enzyme [Flavobacteriales bacterium CG_4_9_14_3_um_filter_40_17]|nr:MAG: YggS family pyridoxal phosphate-dependent enzyme [Flavobacteriales bacterium CG_4_9_14_3_um_filter_40_17]
MSIPENIQQLKKELPKNVSLIAVSKTKPAADLKDAYGAGQREFGENKIQEMAEKWAQLPKDISWHMIGHVQSNKVKYMAEFVSLIHGVDSLKLLQEIDNQAKKYHRVIDCLLQIKIAEEDTKFGLSTTDASNLLKSETFRSLQNIRVVGLMGMATFTSDQTQIKQEFGFLKSYFDMLKNSETANFKPTVLSMGMSQDYALAIQSGSNMVRIGSKIFGERE